MNTLLTLTNEIAIGDDGWAMLGVAFTNEGPRPAIQRVDAEAGETLRRNLRSLRGRAARFFRSVPIFNGHPDSPDIGHKFPDTDPKGYIADLEVRRDGIFIRPIFNDAGDELLNGPRRLGFSAYVDADVVGEENGKILARWTNLRSAGLTDRPNLPVEMVNESQRMNQIIAALAAAGITLANEASEPQVLAAITTLQKQRDDALTLANTRAAEIATATTQAQTAATEFANERAARVAETLAHAVESGRIAESDRAVWEGRLKTNFANESQALAGLPHAWKTQTQMGGGGERRVGASSRDVANQLVALCNEAVAKGEAPSFEVAWVRSKTSHAALHEALKAPAA